LRVRRRANPGDGKTEIQTIMANETLGKKTTQHKALENWVNEMAALCQPRDLFWCDGSDREYQTLCQEMVKSGTFIKLNEKKRPGSYLARSHPSDVARVEDRTYICSKTKEEAGPTNNWTEPAEMKQKLRAMFAGSMAGRTMYVIPFVMGPVGSPLAKVGVQLTDSLYVAISMGIVTRMGDVAWKQLGDSDEFTRCLHSIGDVNPDRRYICHFPLDNTIWSFGSGYGGKGPAV